MSNGIVISEIDSGSRSSKVLTQADGKILVIGTVMDPLQNTDVCITRYNSDGTLDGSFGNNGIIKTNPTNSGGTDWINDAVIQSDGKLVVVGYSAPRGTNDYGLTLIRYNQNGSLDSTFSEDGVAYLYHTTKNLFGHSLAIDTSGSIYIGGSADLHNRNTSGRGTLITKFNPDGTLDTSFGQEGAIIDARSSGLAAIALQSDGKIVAAGNNDNGDYLYGFMVLSRYLSDGRIDDGFAQDGTIETAIRQSSNPSDIIIQPDGKIIVAGNSYSGESSTDFALVRYTSTGHLDTSFSQDGIVLTDYFGEQDLANEIALQADGKILVVGQASYLDDNIYNDPDVFFMANIDIAITRYNSNGTLDVQFSDDGKSVLDLGSHEDIGDSISLQRNGSIIVGATKFHLVKEDLHNGGHRDIALLRLTNNGILDETFGAPNNDILAPSAAVFNPIDEATGVAVEAIIIIVFNENIQRGSGTIQIKTTTGDLLASYNVANSSNISISGKTLAIDPTAYLEYSTTYKIEIAAGAIKDLAGNAYAGTSSYNFRTAADPLAATNGNDTLIGSSQADTIIALAGNDIITGGAGNDSINGGSGMDTAKYSGTIDQYRIIINNASRTVVVIDNQAGRNGTDTLTDVEKILIGNLTYDLFSPALATTPKHAQSRDFLFDSAYYLLSHPELSGSVSLNSAFDHYLTTGAAQGIKPNSWFDPTYYENRWADLKNAHLDDATLFLHYNLYGVWEGRSAGPKFDQYDGERYLQNNPDVAAYVDANVGDFLGSRTNGAIAHYIIYGANEGRVAYDLSGNAITSATLIGIAP